MRFSLRLLLASCAVAGLAGCGDPSVSDKAEKKAALSGRQEVKLRLARATEASGDYAGAEKLYLQVADQSPGAPLPHEELAEFYRRHHEDRKAIESLKTALKIEPGNTQIERALANTYIGAGEPEKALPLLDDAIAINPKDPLLYNSKGVALDQTGNYSEAQQSYKTAYSLDSAGGATYKINMSMSYILSGAYDKAITLLTPMLDAPESPPIVRQNLALAYGMKGESDAALKLGLQDLSTREAEENLRFYRMLAQRRGKPPSTQAATLPPEPPVSAAGAAPAASVNERPASPAPLIASANGTSAAADDAPLPEPMLKPDQR